MTRLILPTLIFPDQAGLKADIERIAALGADGIEIRRERLEPEEALFQQAGRLLREKNLSPIIYSVPADFWQAGRMNPDFELYTSEAESLGADFIKFGLGNPPEQMDAKSLVAILQKLPCRLLVENSQLALHGGTAKAFARFFLQLPQGLAAMTFDTGNWQTVGESADEAYAMLRKYITYVHIKGVRKKTAGWDSIPVKADDVWFSRCRGHALAAVEFPLQDPAKEGKFWLSQLRGEKKMKRFLTFGEPMVMFTAQSEGDLADQMMFRKFVAGAETNVATGMARLGYESYFASRVGRDSLGRFIKKALAKEGIHMNFVSTDDKWPTGFQLKSHTTHGDPEVEYFREFAAFRHISCEGMTDMLMGMDHLHATGIPLALCENTRKYGFQMLKAARAAGLSISFDPNLRPNLWSSREEMVRVTNEAAALADWFLPGIHEGEILTGRKDPEAIADFYLERGVKLVIIKLGKEGAFFKAKDGRSGMMPGVQNVKVVDTVGAGDGFAVGAVSALLEGCTELEALQRGNAIGALAVQFPGDSDGLPTRPVLRDYMNAVYARIA